MAIALAQKRFPEGTAAGDARHEAESEYADALAKVGGATNDAAVMAMAAEAYMNLSPWDYYEVTLSGVVHPSLQKGGLAATDMPEQMSR